MDDTDEFDTKIAEILALDPEEVQLKIVLGPNRMLFATVVSKDGSRTGLPLGDLKHGGPFEQVLKQRGIKVRLSMLM